MVDDENAKKALKRYFDIIEGKRQPKAKLCKTIKVEFSLDDSIETLWEKHDSALESFRRVEVKDIEDFSNAGTSLLDLKVSLANRIFKKCTFCERKCGIDRTQKSGACGVKNSRIASMFHHYGEEPELVPSFTIFFSGCNFHCQFCQNYDISQKKTGYEIPAEELARKLDGIKARNINWVGGSPTPNLNYILETLNYYQGDLSSVWNSNMYMSEEAMKLLEGTQDVFLTDFKYGSDDCALRFSKVKDYTSIVKRNHRLAKVQGELIVRHLILPNHVDCCTKEVASFVAKELGVNTRFNLMFQYRPMFKAHNYEEINRRLTTQEISDAQVIVKEAGLKNVIS